ncbi:ATP-binding protein [Streptomyces sp. NPDC012474]|uniref:ATP-binding protein n=1 Tax=Streptomyces sp. NPDC012474 TaxID=3364836 RepID=UPI0036E3FBF0
MTAPATPQPDVTVRVFVQRLRATPRGARMARHLAVGRLHSWGIPHGTEASDAVALIVSELAANAVTHGRVPGRDFELRLSLLGGSVRVEVTDTHSGPPSPPSPPGPRGVERPGLLDEHGRGLLLVAALADRWEVLERKPAPGKTVRAEVGLLSAPAP